MAADVTNLSLLRNIRYFLLDLPLDIFFRRQKQGSRHSSQSFWWRWERGKCISLECIVSWYLCIGVSDSAILRRLSELLILPSALHKLKICWLILEIYAKYKRINAELIIGKEHEIQVYSRNFEL